MFDLVIYSLSARSLQYAEVSERPKQDDIKKALCGCRRRRRCCCGSGVATQGCESQRSCASWPLAFCSVRTDNFCFDSKLEELALYVACMCGTIVFMKRPAADQFQLRFIKPFLSNYYLKPPKITASTGPSLLFQPVITSSRSGFYECDYNIHKSNSTYFADMDISRTHLLSILFSQGYWRVQKAGAVIAPDGSPAKGPWNTVLGAVASNFRREIKPYEPYEIWTRVLSWDRKWLYMITHFVKKGAVKPAAYTLQGSPESSWTLGMDLSDEQELPNGDAGGHQIGAAILKPPHDAIFASAISKYVLKAGRLTVHPEAILDASGVLPPKPGGWNTMSGTKSQEDGNIILGNGVNSSTTAAEAKLGKPDWRDVERERLRGMQVVEHFAALEGLHYEYTGEDKPALGVYSELLF